MSDPFARMNESIFARLGGGAFLRVDEPCSADIHFGVAIASAGEYGEVTSFRTVVNITVGSQSKPRTGDKITINSKAYTLDALIRDDGYSTRWVVNEFIP